MTDKEKTESDMYDSEDEESEISSHSSDEALSDDESDSSAETEDFRIAEINAQAKPHGDRLYWKDVFYASNISSRDRDLKTMHGSVKKDSRWVIPPTVQNLWGGGNIEVIEPTKEEKRYKMLPRHYIVGIPEKAKFKSDYGLTGPLVGTFSLKTIESALREWYLAQATRSLRSCFMWPACHILYEDLMVVMKKPGFGQTPGLIFYKKDDQIPLEHNETAIPISGRGVRVLLHVFEEFKKWIVKVMSEEEKLHAKRQLGIETSGSSFFNTWGLTLERPQDVVLEESINLPPAVSVPGVENKPLLAGASGRVEIGSYVTDKFGLMPTVTMTFIQNPRSETDMPVPTELDKRTLHFPGPSFLFLVKSAMPFMSYCDRLFDTMGELIRHHYHVFNKDLFL